MGGAHVFSGYCQCLNCDAKKSSFLYKSNLIGNTIIREKNSTKGFIQTFDKKYYISDSYLKDLISIDTELFTASTAGMVVAYFFYFRRKSFSAFIYECVDQP